MCKLKTERRTFFSAFETIDTTFTLGEEYQTNYFLNQVVMLHTCSQPKPNILFFDSYEVAKNWNVTTEMVFSKFGMISKQTFVNDGISTKKFYTKIEETTEFTIR